MTPSCRSYSRPRARVVRIEALRAVTEDSAARESCARSRTYRRSVISPKEGRTGMRLLLALATAVTAGALVALPAIAADNGKITRFAQAETLGYYRGQTVAYLDLGPVKLAAGNKTAPIWVFTNGDD